MQSIKKRIIKIEGIKHFNKALDLFTSAGPDPELLLKGLYPPLPVSGETLIWGFNLLKAAHKLNIQSLNCELLPVMDKSAMLTLALKMENRTGAYSWEEKARITQYLAGVEKISSELGLLLEGKADPDIISRYAQYLSFAVPLKRLVTENLIPFKTAVEISALYPEVFELFWEKQSAWQASFSERRLFLTWFYEIFKRDQLSRKTCLTYLAQLLEAKNPLQQIRTLRYPQLTALENKFNALKNRWLKGSGIELKAPENFEGTTFSINFSFTRKNYQRKLEILKKLEEHVDELTNLL